MPQGTLANGRISCLSVAEAASLTDLSRSTLNKMRVTGLGPVFIKMGRRVAYDSHDLEQWLFFHRRKSTSAKE